MYIQCVLPTSKAEKSNKRYIRTFSRPRFSHRECDILLRLWDWGALLLSALSPCVSRSSIDACETYAVINSDVRCLVDVMDVRLDTQLNSPAARESLLATFCILYANTHAFCHCSSRRSRCAEPRFSVCSVYPTAHYRNWLFFLRRASSLDVFIFLACCFFLFLLLWLLNSRNEWFTATHVAVSMSIFSSGGVSKPKPNWSCNYARNKNVNTLIFDGRIICGILRKACLGIEKNKNSHEWEEPHNFQLFFIVITLRGIS